VKKVYIYQRNGAKDVQLIYDMEQYGIRLHERINNDGKLKRTNLKYYYNENDDDDMNG